MMAAHGVDDPNGEEFLNTIRPEEENVDEDAKHLIEMITDEDVEIAMEAAQTAREGEARQAREAGRLWTDLVECLSEPDDPYEPPNDVCSFDDPIATLVVNGLAMIVANQREIASGNALPYTERTVRRNLSMLWRAHEELCDPNLTEEEPMEEPSPPLMKEMEFPEPPHLINADDADDWAEEVSWWLEDKLTEKISRTFDVKNVEKGTTIKETTTLRFGAFKGDREDVFHIILYSILMNLQNRILRYGTPNQLQVSPVSVSAECTWEKMEFRFNYEITVRKG